MSFEYLAYDLALGKEVLNNQAVDQRLLWNEDNNFHLAAEEYQKLFRLTPDLTEDLISQLDSHLKGSRITAISTATQVLVALQLFGYYQRSVDEQWVKSMSQSSVSRNIHRVPLSISLNKKKKEAV